jgi:hypothetical protein
VRGANYAEVVQDMAAMKMTKPRSRLSYRQSLAQRAKEMYGKNVDWTTDEKFIKSLVDAQLLFKL